MEHTCEHVSLYQSCLLLSVRFFQAHKMVPAQLNACRNFYRASFKINFGLSGHFSRILWGTWSETRCLMKQSKIDGCLTRTLLIRTSISVFIIWHSSVDGRSVWKGSWFISNADGFTLERSFASTLSCKANIWNQWWSLFCQSTDWRDACWQRSTLPLFRMTCTYKMRALTCWCLGGSTVALNELA